MAEAETQLCPVCQVQIIPAPGGDRVLFSTGKPGTRAKLAARVCQFVKQNGCINRDPNLIGEIQSDDYYKPE